jgi:hypothetical protein
MTSENIRVALTNVLAVIFAWNIYYVKYFSGLGQPDLCTVDLILFKLRNIICEHLNFIRCIPKSVNTENERYLKHNITGTYATYLRFYLCGRGITYIWPVWLATCLFMKIYTRCNKPDFGSKMLY